MTSPFFWIVFSLITGALGAMTIKRYGAGLGLTDHPNERSSHRRPVPRGGGIGISAAFALSGLLLGVPYAFLIPACLISLVSLWDDRSDIAPRIRLIVQLILSLAVALWIFFTRGWPSSGLFLVIFSTLFIAGTANCYNFMDGINGIAATTGVVGFGLLFFYGNQGGGDPRFVTLSLVLSAACLGFLPFNCPVAGVFMGDTGSILLGFAFAGITLVFSNGFNDFMVMTGFLFPFYADEAITMVIRLTKKENLFMPHRKHLYQILVNERGIDHWKIACAFGLVQLGAGLFFMMLKPLGPVALFIGQAILFSAMAILNIVVRKKSDTPSP